MIETTTVEFDEELAKKNLAENDFSHKDDDGLSAEEIENIQKDLNNADH